MTDTINTLADPGSDPAHEWRQPENAETILHAITPASLRAHADWIGNGPLPAAEHLRREAARLEAESARDEEAEFYAKVYHRTRRRKSPVLAKWDSLPDDVQADNTRTMRVVLDRLAADGRLLHEGGTVLTADEADDVRTFMRWAAGRNNGMKHPDEAAYRIRVKFGLYDSWVPAPPATSIPDSGPDGTPEKPWPTWDAAPEGAKYRAVDSSAPVYTNHHDEPFVIRGDLACRVHRCEMPTAAPFVRVDGDRA